MERSEGKVGLEQTGSQYKKGAKIYIKPENKGKFTATKKATGKSTEELTHSKNPLTKKRAIFAQNAKKWKHQEGGLVDPMKPAASSEKAIKDRISKVSKLKKKPYPTVKMSEKSKISKQAFGGVLDIIAKFKFGGQLDKTPKEVSKRINIPYKKDKESNLVKTAEVKKGGKLSKEYIEKARKKPGGSNVGKKTFASGQKRTGPYVGPSGGAPKGSYPIPDLKHAKSALSLAYNAPNPEGIKKAVYNKYPQLKKHQNGGIINFDISNILNQWKK